MWRGHGTYRGKRREELGGMEWCDVVWCGVVWCDGYVEDVGGRRAGGEGQRDVKDECRR